MKLKTVTKRIQHTLTTKETAGLNVEFRNAFQNLKVILSEFDNVKATYKAKITEAESRMETLNATLTAGFDWRDEILVVIFDAKAGNRLYLLAGDVKAAQSDPELAANLKPVLVEKMTEEDYQTELLQAEAEFENREEIELFPPTKNDSGLLVVGRQAEKWFSALRVKIGTREITERLDNEQICSKKRYDQISRSCKRFTEWLTENLGEEEAKGFLNQLALVKAGHADREE